MVHFTSGQGQPKKMRFATRENATIFRPFNSRQRDNAMKHQRMTTRRNKAKQPVVPHLRVGGSKWSLHPSTCTRTYRIHIVQAVHTHSMHC